MSDLLVYIDGSHAGEIQTVRHAAAFEYAHSYLRQVRATPLSLSIPLIGGTQPADAWLDGLLPDNDGVRRDWAQHNGVHDTRPVTLLGTPIGLDCAGAVQFCRPGNEPEMRRRGGLDPQSHKDIAAWIRLARTNWAASGRIGSHGQFSLGGAQAKYALHRHGHQWSVPYGDTATTHIIKPGMVGHDDSDAVEHICMRAARIIGLEAARTELERFDDERVLVVERFDRAQLGERTERLHHEDLCQALGVPPENKYQADGGPSSDQIAELFRQDSTDPLADARRFRDALIFNWVIAATDAHAKNYSLLLDRGDVRLAPLYDVISYLPYTTMPHWKIKTAMRIGKDYRLRRADRPSAWELMADTLGLDRQATVERVREMLDDVPDAISEAISELDNADQTTPAVQRLDQLVHQRCKDVRGGFAQPSRSPKQTKKPQTTSSASGSSPRVFICRERLPQDRGQCKRRLTTTPCPFHPHSPGSSAVRQV